MGNRTRLAVTVAVVLAAVCAGRVAAEVAPAEIGYEAASLLAGGCFACHGPEGVAPPGPVPSIAGTPADRMVALLNAFKADEVPGATMMGRIARGYDDAEIAALARYFSGYWDGERTP